VLQDVTFNPQPSSYDLHCRARRERSYLMGTFVRRAIGVLLQGLGTLTSWGVRGVRTLVTQWRLRRAVRALQALNDRALADLGVGRGEIESAVRRGRRPHTSPASKPHRIPIRTSGRQQAA
jgi:uncharacterized protein YjiS (DUF1127 family)